jgi:hypothetical protein
MVTSTVHVPSAVAGSGVRLSVSGVGPVVLLAGSEAVPLLSVQLSSVTAAVTSSLALLVPSSVTARVIVAGPEMFTEMLHL